MDVSDAMQSQAKALGDPSRFRLFRHIVEASGPVGVAELTELLGFNHNAIRQHLQVLREAGLVAETTEERKVRGRPRKQYEARADALNAFGSVTGSYERLAAMLLEIITTGDEPYEIGRRNAAAAPPQGSTSPTEPQVDSSTAADEAAAALLRELAASGFEPTRQSDASIVLQHCPFADVAAQRPGVVCELHRGLIDGSLGGHDGALTGDLQVQDPHRAGCRIVIESSPIQDSSRQDLHDT